MKGKGIVGICIVALLILPSISTIADEGGEDQKVRCYASNLYGVKKLYEKALSYEKLNELEERLTEIFNENFEGEIEDVRDEVLEILQQAKILPEDSDVKQLLPTFRKKDWGWGIFNYVISYGRGEIFVPLKLDRSFLRLFLRPIFFNYNLGFTVAKLGATYIWDSECTIGNVGLMLGRQRGFMIRFVGIHVRIPHQLIPDSHLFIGATIMINGNNLIF